MNTKAFGEKGERIAIGELAKFDIDVAVPLSDNLPFDLILFHNNKLYKAQVKSSKTSHIRTTGSLCFNLTCTDYRNKTFKTYCSDQCDVMILCDYTNIFLLGPTEFSGKTSFTIRYHKSSNNQSKNCNTVEDYILSEKRISEVFV